MQAQGFPHAFWVLLLGFCWAPSQAHQRQGARQAAGNVGESTGTRRAATGAQQIKVGDIVIGYSTKHKSAFDMQEAKVTGIASTWANRGDAQKS